MKKYKKNITITFACLMNELFISIIPMYIIIQLFMDPKGINEIPLMVGYVTIAIIFIDLLLYVVSLIGRIFIKTIYIIDNNDLIVKSDGCADKIIRLQLIRAITYDLGEMDRYNTQPSRLTLYDMDYKRVISIENPPLSMVIKIKKKCFTAKVNYLNLKRPLILFLFATILSIVICVIGILI